MIHNNNILVVLNLITGGTSQIFGHHVGILYCRKASVVLVG